MEESVEPVSVTPNGYLIDTPGKGTRVAKRVTEILRLGMPKPAIVEWQLRECVRYALDRPDSYSSPDECIAAWRRDSRGSADRGTKVHNWIAAQYRGQRAQALPASCVGYQDAWCAWVADEGIGTPEYVEQTVTTAHAVVAGTMDAQWKGGLVVDWKTSAKSAKGPPFHDHLAQLGGYSTLRFPVIDGAITPDLLENVSEARIVRLCADGKYVQHAISGQELDQARALWESVRHVALAISK